MAREGNGDKESNTVAKKMAGEGNGDKEITR